MYPQRLDNICREASSASLAKSLFKTIFQVNYCLNWMSTVSQWALKMCWVAFHSVTDDWHFHDHLPSNTIGFKALSPGRPEQCMCTAESSWGSLLNTLFKTVVQVKLSYWLKALFPERTEQWTCRAESSPVLLTNGLLKTIFLSKTIISTHQSSAFLGELSNECAEAFSVSPTNNLFKTIFWAKLSPQRLCFPVPMNNEHEEFSSVLLRNSLFKTIFWVKLSYWLTEAMSPRRMKKDVLSFFCILFNCKHNETTNLCSRFLVHFFNCKHNETTNC